MHRAGWERLVNWQTFLWGDVEALLQNMLLAMLRTKIWTLWTIWELICLYDGGPQLADPEVRIKTSEVEIPQASFKENVTKVRGKPGCLLLDFGSNSSQMTGSRACWPQRRIPDILPSDSEVLVFLQRADGLLTICVAGGGVRERADNLLISLFLSHFQTLCGLNSVESLCESM